MEAFQHSYENHSEILFGEFDDPLNILSRIFKDKYRSSKAGLGSECDHSDD